MRGRQGVGDRELGWRGSTRSWTRRSVANRTGTMQWWPLGPPVARSQVRQPPEDGTPGTSELKHVISSKVGAEDGRGREGGCLGHERRRGHAGGGGWLTFQKLCGGVAAFCTAMMLEEATHGTPRPQQTPTAPCKQTGGFLLGSNANRILQFRVHSHGKHT